MAEASAFIPFSTTCRAHEDVAEADWHQFGLLAAWYAAGVVCLLLYGLELVYHSPFDAQKIIVILGLVFWLRYLAALAKASLRCTPEWRRSGGTNLVAAWGIALPTMVWQLGRTFPLQRGYPAVEASIVSCVCTFSGLLPMKSVLLVDILYWAVSTCNLSCRLFASLGGVLPSMPSIMKSVAVNVCFGFPSCCILCLARNRVTSQTNLGRSATALPLGAASGGSASDLAAPAVKAIICTTAMLAASSCMPDGSAAVQQEWAPSDHVALALRAALAAIAAAVGTAIVSAATTAWLPPGAGALNQLLKRSPRFAAVWAKCGLADVRPVPPSQCVTSALLFPWWAQRGEKWLLDAVSQDMAETILATMAALFLSVRFIMHVASFVKGRDYLWSPTQDMLSIFAGITLGSSKGQHLQNFLSVQRRMYRSASTLLRGVVPGHVADAMEADMSAKEQEEEEQVHSALQPAKSLTPTSSNAADWMFGSFARAPVEPSVEVLKAEEEEHALSGTFGNAPPQQNVSNAAAPAGGKNARSLSMNSAKRLIAPALATVQRLEDSRSRSSRLKREPSFPPQGPERQNTFLERHEDVTIVFCDLVGFTALSEQITPHEVMCLLGDLYRKYDELAAKLKLYTLDTIGDCYMCAANLIYPLDSHVDAAVGFAQSIIEIASRTYSSLGKPLSVRVGLHTGPVIAGILGYHRFKFTTVGDTVNTASRLQACAPPNTLMISDHCYKQLSRPETAAVTAAAATAATASSSGFDEGIFEDMVTASLSYTHQPKRRNTLNGERLGESKQGSLHGKWKRHSSSPQRAKRRSNNNTATDDGCVNDAALRSTRSNVKRASSQQPSRPLQKPQQQSQQLLQSSGRQGEGSLRGVRFSRDIASPTQSTQHQQSPSDAPRISTHQQPSHAPHHQTTTGHKSCALPHADITAPHHTARSHTCHAQPHNDIAASNSVVDQAPPPHTSRHTFQARPHDDSAADLVGGFSSSAQNSDSSGNAVPGGKSPLVRVGTKAQSSSSSSGNTSGSAAEGVGGIGDDGEPHVRDLSLPTMSKSAGCCMKRHHPYWYASVVDVKGKGTLKVFSYVGPGSGFLP